MFGRSSLGFSSREILIMIAAGVLAATICWTVQAAPVGDPTGREQVFEAVFEVPQSE